MAYKKTKNINMKLLEKYYSKDNLNVTEIARLMKICPTTIYSRIDLHNLKRPCPVESPYQKMCDFLDIQVVTYEMANKYRQIMYKTIYAILISNKSKRQKKQQIYSLKYKVCYLDNVWENYTHTSAKYINDVKSEKKFREIKQERKMMFG